MVLIIFLNLIFEIYYLSLVYHILIGTLINLNIFIFLITPMYQLTFMGFNLYQYFNIKIFNLILNFHIMIFLLFECFHSKFFRLIGN
jgi:hypothetical protein